MGIRFGCSKYHYKNDSIIMMKFLKKFLRWQLKFLFSMYGPGLLTLLFAIGLVHFFPDGPIWPIGVFAILMVVLFSRYMKW